MRETRLRTIFMSTDLKKPRDIPLWQRRGSRIRRTYEFENFVSAIRFVSAVAEAAEMEQHHPDIDIRWNRVTLTLTTHDAGGLTEKDFHLARRCDHLAQILAGEVAPR